MRVVTLKKVDVAAHLFMSVQQFDNFRHDGVLPSPKGRAGYDQDLCRRMYIEYLRGKSRAPADAGGGVEGEDRIAERLRNQDTIVEEKARLAAEQANKLAMENALRRRELAPIAVLREYAEQTANVVRSGLEAVPGALKRGIPHLRASEVQIAKREIARITDSIASFDLSTTGDP